MRLITIHNKIIAVVLGIVLIFAPFIFIYFPNQQQKLLEENYNQEVTHIAATVALGVNIALDEQNFSGVQMAMQYAKSDRRLKFIALVQIDTLESENGKKPVIKKEPFTVYPEKIKLDLNAQSSDLLIVKTAPIASEMLSGEVMVGYSTEEIRENIAQIRWTSFLGSFAVSVVGILIGLLLARNISRPILQLRDAHKKVGEGDLTHRISVRSRDEIGEVTASFNQMVRKIDMAEKELQFQKSRVEEKNKEIIDSISYAKRIQYSLLADQELLIKYIPDHFIFFQPKDIVSGDFYWAGELGNGQFALVAADSTGHGVPGAIMSMLNISCLNESVQGRKLTSPADILNHTRKKVIEHMMHDGSTEGGKDGMDCALVCLDIERRTLTYAAANNPVWILRKGEILEFAPDKMPVGKHAYDHIPFTEKTVILEKGDVIYLMTDGMLDQFGGPSGKKYKYKQLKSVLLAVGQLPMKEQADKLRESFDNWKGDLEQLDDVCVIGVRM